MHRLTDLSTVVCSRRSFLSRYALPIAAASSILILAAIGWWTLRSVDQSIKRDLRDELNALLRADVGALELWLNARKALAQSIAEAPRLRELALSAQNNQTPTNHEQLRSILMPICEPWELLGYAFLDPTGRCFASSLQELVGDRTLIREVGLGQQALSGEVDLIRPVRVSAPLHKSHPDLKPNQAFMMIEAPVKDDDGEIIAAVCFWFLPESGFLQSLARTRIGRSGEAYAFDRDGLMVSQSRFDDQLKEIGLLPNEPDATSFLSLQVRNPGGDLTKGFRPTLPRNAQPLTRAAADAISGKTGVDVEGYPDYRGVPVVGAWTWLPEYDIGIACETDADEAYHSLQPIQTAFIILLAILTISTIAMLIASAAATSMRRRAQEAEIKAQKLGQYTLGGKLGEGGMGAVYKAKHAMLKRPTAIKLMKSQDNERAIQRFEREVQITSQLTHPNTIAIYDFGRTEQGIFYYAMEFLDGLPLDELVAHTGPMPEGRVLHILRQVCQSLREAHEMDLIHRDIKPPNIMVGVRGGIPDFVKVLDFGLVKSAVREDLRITAPSAVTGTPQYLAPEAIQHPDSVDSRSDIYAVGAVAYFMLTGEAVFDANSTLDVINHHLKTEPLPPSTRAGRAISNDLEALVLRCLAKLPEHRPATMRELLEAITNCQSFGTWSENDAAKWWNSHARQEGDWDRHGDETLPVDRTTTHDA